MGDKTIHEFVTSLRKSRPLYQWREDLESTFQNSSVKSLLRHLAVEYHIKAHVLELGAALLHVDGWTAKGDCVGNADFINPGLDSYFEVCLTFPTLLPRLGFTKKPSELADCRVLQKEYVRRLNSLFINRCLVGAKTRESWSADTEDHPSKTINRWKEHKLAIPSAECANTHPKNEKKLNKFAKFCVENWITRPHFLAIGLTLQPFQLDRVESLYDSTMHDSLYVAWLHVIEHYPVNIYVETSDLDHVVQKIQTFQNQSSSTTHMDLLVKYGAIAPPTELTAIPPIPEGSEVEYSQPDMNDELEIPTGETSLVVESDETLEWTEVDETDPTDKILEMIDLTPKREKNLKKIDDVAFEISDDGSACIFEKDVKIELTEEFTEL